ncbi:MAG TPA: dihydrodipicolinate synthase family protein [Bryobacteraceae bacterium]|nr:dihydrodipicolinate synthase family protein [Bryobacteraceae bacterium]
MTKPNWHGVFPAATTHFHKDYTLNLPAFQNHLDQMVRAGVHGMVVLGSVGENTAHDYNEKLTVLEAAKEAIAGRVPLLSGVAEFTTATACRYARDCELLGMDGLMVLPAMVYKSDPRETLAHFRAVARASGLPVMIYNNPPAYATDVTPAMFEELASEPTIVSIKESSGDTRRLTDLVNLTGDRYILFSGVDDLVLESALLGAVGWISGLVNAFPAENRALWDLILAGKWQEALALYRWYTPLLHLDTHVKLVQYIKLAAQETGLCSETTRPPRLPLEGEERQRILAIIRRAIAARPTL